MTNRAVCSIAIAACLTLVGCERLTTAPKTAAPERPSYIIHGSVDGDAHPAVILLVMDVAGVPTWRCTGTLIAPKIVVTAGHCTGEPGEFSAVRAFTESDIENGDNNYPYDGPNSVKARAWHSHPQFTEALYYLHDVGVVELQESVDLPASAYGRLPAANQLDALHSGRSTVFTAVGYGVQRINPVKEESVKIRMTASPYLLQINTGFTGNFSLMLSNNASSGGTCFGDSGGPNYLGTSNVIAGVTSFGLNRTCGGTGGVFRLDRPDVLAFVGQYLGR
jgi:secreted trypsin-like serine protease